MADPQAPDLTKHPLSNNVKIELEIRTDLWHVLTETWTELGELMLR